MAIFTDSNYSTLETYFNILLNPTYGNSYLAGGRRGAIRTTGSTYTPLYQKKDDGDFVCYRFNIDSIDGNRFVFTYGGMLSTHSTATALEVGKEMYFRKDAFFRDWVNFNDDDYGKYINKNKTYIYFGKLYQYAGSTTKYYVEFKGIKDWALEALPEHNRTTNIEEFLKLSLDGVFHEVYNKTKSLWSMFDPKEVSIDHIYYIANKFGFVIDEDMDELKLREWVDNLNSLIKRKGTYSAYYIIFNLLFSNTRNKLNIYERWSEWCNKRVYGDIPQFEDHHILEYYGQHPSGGSGDMWYSPYAPSGYPVHMTDAPTDSCFEVVQECGDIQDYNGYNGNDLNDNIKYINATNLHIRSYRPSAAGLYWYDNDLGTDTASRFTSIAVSGNGFKHCTEVEMAASAAPSASSFIWAVSNTLAQLHTIDNWIGVSYDITASDTRRFKIWENYGGTVYTTESSGTFYNEDEMYYITVEKRLNHDTTLVSNGDMESSPISASWTAGNSASLTQPTSGSVTGYALQIREDGADNPYVYQTVSLSPGNKYTLIGNVNAPAGTSGVIRVQESGGDSTTYAEVEVIGNGTMQEGSVDFKIPTGDSGNVNVILLTVAANGTRKYAKFDDISIYAPEINLYIYGCTERKESNLLERVNHQLHRDETYDYIYSAQSYQQPTAGGLMSMNIGPTYWSGASVNTVGPTGYKYLTPHYKVEVDLSTEPLEDDSIISEFYADELVRYWEYIKPVSKYYWYHFVLAPTAVIDDFGDWISLYDTSEETAVCSTTFLGAGGSLLSALTSASSGAGSNLPADAAESTYVHNNPTQKIEWIITHNLDTEDIIYQFYDENDDAMWPNNVEILDSNNILADFEVPARGTAYIAGLKSGNYTHTQSTSSSTWNIAHSQGVSGVGYNIYNLDRTEVFEADTITRVDVDNMTATFTTLAVSAQKTGLIHVRDDDYFHIQQKASSTWSIAHNMDSSGFIVRCWDDSDEIIYPEDITLTSTNTLTITFSEDVAGSAALIYFERDFTADDVKNLLEGGVWQLGDEHTHLHDPHTEGKLYSPTVSGDIGEIYESDTHLYVDFSIPRGTGRTIGEVGIFGNDGRLAFYTRTSTLYKPSDVQLDFHYRISKE